MTAPVITMSVKEAEAVEAEMAALVEANSKLTAELATAKTATEKAPALDKIAEAVAGVLAELKMVSADKVAETKVALAQEGGLARYFKKTCELYRGADLARKEAEARLKETPARLGKPAEGEKKAGEAPPNALKAAEDRFAARVLSTR